MMDTLTGPTGVLGVLDLDRGRKATAPPGSPLYHPGSPLVDHSPPMEGQGDGRTDRIGASESPIGCRPRAGQGYVDCRLGALGCSGGR